MAKRLLAINWEMPPLSGPRAVQVSRTLKYLAPLGWESTVICFGPRSRRYNQDRGLAAQLALPDKVKVVRVPSLEERFLFRVLWRVCPPVKLLPDEKWVWIARASRTARRIAAGNHFDALVSFGQPWSDHLIGRRVRRATRLPWIAHFSDPWTDSPYLRGREWQRRLWGAMEASVVREADALVFVNAQTADRVMRKYPSEWRAKSFIVPHGFDCADVPRAGASANNGSLELVHTGRFYGDTRTPAPLLRAIAALERRRPLAGALHVTFVGTPEREHQRLAGQLGLDGVVEFVGRKPFAEAASRAAAADALLVIDAPGEENLFLPSKLVEYLPLGKPILGLTPLRGASADLIRSLGYATVPPDDEAAIAAALDSLIIAKTERRLGVSSAHSTVAQQYDIRQTAKAFADVLERCA